MGLSPSNQTTPLFTFTPWLANGSLMDPRHPPCHSGDSPAAPPSSPSVPCREDISHSCLLTEKHNMEIMRAFCGLHVNYGISVCRILVLPLSMLVGSYTLSPTLLCVSNPTVVVIGLHGHTVTLCITHTTLHNISDMFFVYIEQLYNDI